MIGSFCVQSLNGEIESFTIYRGRQSVRDVFAHGEVLIGTAVARGRKLDVGDELTIPGRTGMRTFTVGAIWGDPNNVGNAISVRPEDFDRAARALEL